MQIDRDILAKLIKEASEAHHEYEQTLDGRDEQWAQWYADYVLGRLEEEMAVADETGEALPEEENMDE